MCERQRQTHSRLTRISQGRTGKNRRLGGTPPPIHPLATKKKSPNFAHKTFTRDLIHRRLYVTQTPVVERVQSVRVWLPSTVLLIIFYTAAWLKLSCWCKAVCRPNWYWVQLAVMTTDESIQFNLQYRRPPFMIVSSFSIAFCRSLVSSVMDAGLLYHF